ncbi:unnamed protein product [Prorocentrum cordatum]|uniref:Deacetylase sirtuin-type domain-containing protein n=1 Tax=Prorocentrum cordatum TaxID=2364126 RepID=A0ABN9UJC9_9DINO|nr:unnamed protein product [Polarella glacialis]
MVLSGAGMSTAAGIPDFRSPGGLYGTAEQLLGRFTYLGGEAAAARQKAALGRDIKSALTLELFRENPLPYHEMRRGLILGIGAGQWKCSLGHVLPGILAANGKLRMLASQNIDGLDHKVVAEKSKLYNPHGLMSTLVSEPLEHQRRGQADITLCTDPRGPIYRRYVELVKASIKDIYHDRPLRQGRSSHLWPGPGESTPITLAMFGDLLPAKFHRALDTEARLQQYSVKPGSVMFDRPLWSTTADGKPYNVFADMAHADAIFVMGTSLSGLTIDHVAHEAREDQPRVVFDITSSPAESIEKYGEWRATDCLLRGPIDKSTLDVLDRMGWLMQLLHDDYLRHLCLNSLRELRDFVDMHADDAVRAQVGIVDVYLEEEQRRERHFYQNE